MTPPSPSTHCIVHVERALRGGYPPEGRLLGLLRLLRGKGSRNYLGIPTYPLLELMSYVEEGHPPEGRLLGLLRLLRFEWVGGRFRCCDSLDPTRRPVSRPTMPTTKRHAAPATGADEASSDTQVAQQLSALLKKSQAARTAALFRADCPVSQHIIREAERAALDPNMMLAVYLGVVAQVLNPCAHARYRIVPLPNQCLTHG